MLNLLSWKTTVAGVAAVLLGLGSMLNAFANGDTSTIPDDVTKIAIGLGLIFAKDASK